MALALGGMRSMLKHSNSRVCNSIAAENNLALHHRGTSAFVSFSLASRTNYVGNTRNMNFMQQPPRKNVRVFSGLPELQQVTDVHLDAFREILHHQRGSVLTDDDEVAPYNLDWTVSNNNLFSTLIVSS